jgi:hypothetical protein
VSATVAKYPEIPWTYLGLESHSRSKDWISTLDYGQEGTIVAHLTRSIHHYAIPQGQHPRIVCFIPPLTSTKLKLPEACHASLSKSILTTFRYMLVETYSPNENWTGRAIIVSRLLEHLLNLLLDA